MKTLGKQLRSVGLVVTLFLGSLGCSHAPVGPSPLSAEIRGQLGNLGVAYQGPASLTVQAKPVRGAAQGAGTGAMTALVGTFQAALSGGGHPMGSAGLIMLSPGFVAIGALLGAALAPSAEAVEEAETLLDLAVADPDLPAAVRDHIVQAVQGQNPQATVVLPDPAPAAEDEYLVEAIRSREGIDTILEIQGPTIGLWKEGGPINPSLRLSVGVSTRLIRAADRDVLYTFSPEYRGETRTFTDWAADNAQAFREEIPRASEAIAAQIVTQLFGPDPSPNNEVALNGR
jgi:hypothetical protein